MRIILIIILAVSISSISCNNKPGTESAKQESPEANKEEHGSETITALSEEQIKTIGIATGPIEQKELTNSIKANGILTVPNQNKAFVTPLHSGVVKSLNIQPGSFVKQGQAIATIVNPELLDMQQRLQQLNTQITLAETEVKRQKELVEGNAAPLKKLQQAEAELATLRAERAGLQQQLGAVGASQTFSSAITVRAPISGTVSKVNAQLGSNVDVTTPVAEIVNNSQLHLDLFVYEKDLPKMRPHQTIHFTLTNNPGKEYDAQIYSIGTAFESNTKTIPIHARVIGDKTGLIDGMNITAVVSLDKSTVPAVPSDAIVSFQGQDYVFVVIEDKVKVEVKDKGKEKEMSFERIPVAKGTSDIGYTEITLLKKIPADAKIVLKGAFFVLAKMTNVEEE